MFKTVQNWPLYTTKSFLRHLKSILTDKLETLTLTPKMNDLST